MTEFLTKKLQALVKAWHLRRIPSRLLFTSVLVLFLLCTYPDDSNAYSLSSQVGQNDNSTSSISGDESATSVRLSILNRGGASGHSSSTSSTSFPFSANTEQQRSSSSYPSTRKNGEWKNQNQGIGSGSGSAFTGSSSTNPASSSSSNSSPGSSESAGNSGTSGGSTTPNVSYYVRVNLSHGGGPIQGIRRLGVDFFGGIPYAAPPVGNLRWSPPQQPPSWKPHVLDATQYGPDCYQTIDPVLNPFADASQMSEDCLYLNVFTPAGASANNVHSSNINNNNNNKQQHTQNGDGGLPVLVFFHGGAFQQGSSHRPEYDGRRWAEDLNVIVVTCNYRLGSLGFLVQSELGLYGNYGLMDQRAVLDWVSTHIRVFGGNSDNITLFGESAGAVMIGLHLMMDNHSRWFHKAILQSNPMGYQFRSVVVADFLGDALRRAVDCMDLACLKGEPVEELMRAQSTLMGIPRSVGDFFTWGPTLTHQKTMSWSTTPSNGPFSTAKSSSSAASLNALEQRSLFSVEKYNKQRESTKFAVNVTQPLLNLDLVPDHVPIIIGTNKHEGEMFVHGAFPLTMSKAVYWMFVGALFKDSASRVLQHYRPYVQQLELEASKIAEDQIREEEHKQYYHEHEEELREDYAWLFQQNKKWQEENGSDNGDVEDAAEKAQIVSAETIEQLVQTFDSGGAFERHHNVSWWRQAGRSVRKAMPGENSQQNRSLELMDNRTWWKEAMKRLIEKPSPEVLEARRLAKAARIKERARLRALNEAAKVVIDYRPVMSRIIDDYLFRCPSWHYAQMLSRNRVGKQKTNNVYVYRFSQPTHVPGYKECWGKSCHTAELPYVFRSMDVVRSNYSTLSEFAQREAPIAPEYPYTDMMNAYQEMLQALENPQTMENTTASSSTAKSYDMSFKPVTRDDDAADASNNNQTMSFQRLLKHFFDDYFHSDADDETSNDMSQRWVAFARTGDPNYEDSKVQWSPWRYIPNDEFAHLDESTTSFNSADPFEGLVIDEDEFWIQDENGRLEFDEERFGHVLRERALQAMHMEVIEEDVLRTELRLTKASKKPDPDNPFFSLRFFSNRVSGKDVDDEKTNAQESAERRRVQQAAQEMGVLGTGLRGEERNGVGGGGGVGSIFQTPSQRIRQVRMNEDFFPQLLELKWPPEERLVERDCTCDFWDRIRYRY